MALPGATPSRLPSGFNRRAGSNPFPEQEPPYLLPFPAHHALMNFQWM